MILVKVKKIVFLTGTRADFGKLKSLISITQQCAAFETHIFATGMHLNSKYGKTVIEIIRSGFENVFQFINHDTIDNMDRTLAKTIDGFSLYIKEVQPDLIVVHGDRVEALAGAITGSINNILVAHVEGGEISGTIDEVIRHAVSKMSHIHFVANDKAKKRLIQLGEKPSHVFVIGSPDLDLMNLDSLPSLHVVRQYYQIDFCNYAIAMFHPVTTEYACIAEHASQFVSALIESAENYVVIFPNNDLGSLEILREYEKLQPINRFRVFPSLRFEYFLRLLQSADFIIGNSSAGLREAPFYGTPTVDIGSRQLNRAKARTILHCGYRKNEILASICDVQALDGKAEHAEKYNFGCGNSDKQFLQLLEGTEIWKINHQKQFQELDM
jgi:UDP-N-acetylglucosamine 2-epimerase (hydrolysing)